MKIYSYSVRLTSLICGWIVWMFNLFKENEFRVRSIRKQQNQTILLIFKNVTSVQPEDYLSIFIISV